MKRFDKKIVGFLSRDEIQALWDAPDVSTWYGQRDRLLFATLYNTGARVSEIIGLRISDIIIGQSSHVHIMGKGRKERTVPLWHTTAQQIKNWLHSIGVSPEQRLFPNSSGQAMTRSNVTDRLQLAVKVAAKKCPQLLQHRVSPHVFRHSTAMHLLQSGVDINVIALWLGHESPATTHMYMQADLSMKERALNNLQPPGTAIMRYQPPDELLKFLEDL